MATSTRVGSLCGDETEEDDWKSIGTAAVRKRVQPSRSSIEPPNTAIHSALKLESKSESDTALTPRKLKSALKVEYEGVNINRESRCRRQVRRAMRTKWASLTNEELTALNKEDNDGGTTRRANMTEGERAVNNGNINERRRTACASRTEEKKVATSLQRKEKNDNRTEAQEEAGKMRKTERMANQAEEGLEAYKKRR